MFIFGVAGFYPKAGVAGDKMALLVVLGLNENGEKEPLAIFEGYRESSESWGFVLRDLKARGLADPKLFIGDGALGLWAAIGLRETYGASTREQASSLMDVFAERYTREYPRATECLLKDRDSLLTYYSYPREHWQSIKTTNPI